MKKPKKRIKFSSSQETRAIKKGTAYITTDVDKGPTSESGYYSTIDPPLGGHTIYIDKASNGPSIFVLNDNDQLITFTNVLAGASYTTITECFDYYESQSDKTCVSSDYGRVITDGLALYVNCLDPSSYTGTGTVWKDLSENGNDVVLVNGVTFTFKRDLETGAGIQDSTKNLNYLQNYTSASFPYVSSTEGPVIYASSSLMEDKGEVWGESDPCSGNVTFYQALALAHDRGARLPTRQELYDNKASGTGCGYDLTVNWTADKANADGTLRYATVGINGSSADDVIIHITGSATMRWVADEDTSRIDPVTITDDPILYNYLTQNYVFSESVTISYDSNLFRTFYFDGANDYSYVTNLNYGGGNTISEMSTFVWMKTLVTGANTGDGGIDTNQWAFLDFDRSEVFQLAVEPGGQLKFSGYSSNNGGLGSSTYDLGAGTGTLFNDGDWHFIGVTFSVANQEIKFYGDGVLLRTLTANGSMTALGAGVTRYGFIGDGSEASSQNSTRNNTYYQGYIASVMFHDNRVLTLEEIQEIYNSQKDQFPSGIPTTEIII